MESCLWQLLRGSQPDPFNLEDRKHQASQICRQDRVARRWWDVGAHHFAELRSEAASTDVASIDDATGAELAHGHLHETCGGIGTGKVGVEVVHAADCANSDLPIAARMSADDRHGRMPARQLR